MVENLVMDMDEEVLRLQKEIQDMTRRLEFLPTSLQPVYQRWIDKYKSQLEETEKRLVEAKTIKEVKENEG